jgi:hypothetical protein
VDAYLIKPVAGRVLNRTLQELPFGWELCTRLKVADENGITTPVGDLEVCRRIAGGIDAAAHVDRVSRSGDLGSAHLGAC